MVLELVCGELAERVDIHAVQAAPPSPDNRDVYPAIDRGRQAAEARSRVVAKECSRPAGEERSGLVGEGRGRAKANQVDAGVHGDENARGDPALNHPGRKPEPKQLLAGDSPVPAPREVRQLRFEFPPLHAHMG